MPAAISKVENSALVLSCWLNFVHGTSTQSNYLIREY